MKRLQPDDRKTQILAAALVVCARPGGWAKLTREGVAKEAGCAESLPSKYFGTMTKFKRTIMRAAIKECNLAVIAQGLAAGDSAALKADSEIKQKALATLVA